MKKQIVYVIIAASASLVPLVLTSGCAVTHHQESARSYVDDKAIATKIKTKLYADKLVKGTEVKVQSLNGVVELSGFVDTEEAKQRAGQIAAETAGVVKVYNNLILPTGR